MLINFNMSQGLIVFSSESLISIEFFFFFTVLVHAGALSSRFCSVIGSCYRYANEEEVWVVLTLVWGSLG